MIINSHFNVLLLSLRHLSADILTIYELKNCGSALRLSPHFFFSCLFSKVAAFCTSCLREQGRATQSSIEEEEAKEMDIESKDLEWKKRARTHSFHLHQHLLIERG